MIQHSNQRYGPRSRDRSNDLTDTSINGARAALESFYHALNNRDGGVLRTVWSDDPLTQLNNPLGGILRGGSAIAELYDQIFAGPVRLTITFSDIVEYAGDDHVVFAGRETGTYSVPEHRPTELTIRTSRYFRFADRRWSQFHHHGSIDDPDALADYQRAVAANPVSRDSRSPKTR